MSAVIAGLRNFSWRHAKLNKFGFLAKPPYQSFPCLCRVSVRRMIDIAGRTTSVIKSSMEISGDPSEAACSVGGGGQLGGVRYDTKVLRQAPARGLSS
jgi:hypothetical protein